MARTTYVKRAQQRYATVPVIDPETGEQKVTPVLRRDGSPKVTKRGRPVVMRLTREDRTKPLPPVTCDACRKPIEVGTPYKWIKPKSGPYGGSKRSRHADCPGWQIWDYSSSMSAQLARVSHDFDLAMSQGYETPEEVTERLSEAAEGIREIAEAKREAAQNIEEGFGHETEQSMELADIAEQLDSWADEVENADVPDLPEPEEGDCEECDGTGTLGEVEGDCPECNGTGQTTPDEPTDDQMDQWRSEVEDAVSIVNECPV